MKERTVTDDIREMLALCPEDVYGYDELMEIMRRSESLDRERENGLSEAEYKNRRWEIARSIIHLGIWYERVGVWRFPER